MSVGHDHAAVEQGEARAAERDRHIDSVRAVGINIERIGSVGFLEVFAIDHRNRDLHAVFGRRPDAFRFVIGGIEPAGNLILLEQRGCVFFHVVIED